MTEHSEATAEAFDFSKVDIDTSLALYVPASISKRQGAIAFAIVDGVIFIARANDTDVDPSSALLRYLPEHSKIKVEKTDPSLIEQAQLYIYGTNTGTVESGNTPQSVRIVNAIFNKAVAAKASDIHLNPEENLSRCKVRVDGTMEDHGSFSIEDHHKIVSRIKVLADLNISERRLPQDGKFSYSAPNSTRPIDIRVATIPTKHGEKVTLRLIGALELPEKFSSLGFSNEHSSVIEKALNKPQGLILVSGPTGSGKSTTLYTFLNYLKAREGLSLISLEDPVEYELPGVTQVHIDHKKTSFAVALRSVLRHDPDVILVGEIRDADTASIAVRAALTGHLVLSTIHTNTASSVPQRLVDMGIPPYLVASTLNLVIAQRLVRKICHACQRPATDTYFGNSFTTSGCLYCRGTGFKGRSGVYELLENHATLAGLISDEAGSPTIDKHSRERGELSIFEDAKKKVNAGEIDAQSAIKAVGTIL